MGRRVTPHNSNSQQSCAGMPDEGLGIAAVRPLGTARSGGMAASIEYIRAGRLRALAVTTASRSEALPDIPTVGDFVTGFDASQWVGLCAPKNTPPEIIGKLNTEIKMGLADPKLKARIAELGGTVLPGSPAVFFIHDAATTEKWGKVVKFSGAKPE